MGEVFDDRILRVKLWNPLLMLPKHIKMRRVMSQKERLRMGTNLMSVVSFVNAGPPDELIMDILYGRDPLLLM